ncbi:MFS transporter [Streptomyces sp. B6B3]|uniref:MFS transporter n=1 Tax=Streptomyces sp. B6B3 TaxID=3153570 RepID=UPI00325F2EA2
MKKRYSWGSYLLGVVTARTGDDMSGPSLLLVGLAVTGSATSASSLLAGITITAAIGGPVLGLLLDRAARPGRLLAGALAGYAVALLVILASLGRLPLGCTVLIAVFAGLARPALSAGWTSQLPRVVTPEKLPRANALDAMTFDLASVVAPALVAAVTLLSEPSVGMLASCALICLALPSAWRLPAAPGGPRTPRDASVVADITAGLRAILRSPPLARATAVSVVSCAGEGMLLVCVPLLGERVLGGADTGTFLLSAMAVSALVANALLSRFPRLTGPDTLLWCSTLVLAAAVLLAATGQPVPLVAAMLLAGMGEGPQLTALFAVRHREAPAALRGQIFTTGASLKLSAYALGAGLAGPVATWSLSGALLTAAGFQVLAVLTFAWITAVRRGPRAEKGNDRLVRGVERG